MNNSDKPIGVATYKIYDSLPEQMKNLHDCVSCKCDACSIDGGNQYTRIVGNFKYINCINEDGTEEPLIKNNVKVIEVKKDFLIKRFKMKLKDLEKEIENIKIRNARVEFYKKWKKYLN